METQGVSAASRDLVATEVFNPPSVEFAKRVARRVQKACYTVAGEHLKLSVAQEAVARAYGHQNWFNLAHQIGRDGYRASRLDAALPAALVEARRKQQREALQVFLDLYPSHSSQIAQKARLSSAPIHEPSDGPSRAAAKDTLPLAAPRPGLSEILLTAYPFSIIGTKAPLPGWPDYVVVAAPGDNSALWVRFCHENAVADEGQVLVRAIATLSGGALT